MCIKTGFASVSGSWDWLQAHMREHYVTADWFYHLDFLAIVPRIQVVFFPRTSLWSALVISVGNQNGFLSK